MTQVAGRAGRRSEQGVVIIQTAQPQHPVIEYVVNGDYKSLAQEQLSERETFFYPPYCRIIGIEIKGRDNDLLWQTANDISKELTTALQHRIIGPVSPLIDRVRGENIVSIIVKVERNAKYSKVKEIVKSVVTKFQNKKVLITCNVDI
jgi:primosomal protein N' (replication factor Y)